jgi:TonB family protein
MQFLSRLLHGAAPKLRQKDRRSQPFLALLATAMAFGPALAAQPQSAPAAVPVPVQPAAQAESGNSGAVTEDELKRQLVGKPLFLRGGYLGDSLNFTEHGDSIGHPSVGSYTLSAVQIDRVRLTKHRVELQGSRYGLHFLGALPYEDPSKAVDRIKITPKKKVLKISIDREQVIKPKKLKEPRKGKSSSAEESAAPVASSETDVPADTATAIPSPAAANPAQADDSAAAQAADQASVTTTISPAHAAKVLHDALDRIFSPALDEKLLAQMPEFWQLYYRAQAAGVDYRPSDPHVLRSAAVDQQARVTSSITPDSNEFAQSSGIAGRALYRAVIEPDGKPGEIAVVRPIGFGLDENAVAAIRKASFQPASKNGQPVAETLDLAVTFRIYSKRTSVAATDANAGDPAKSIKPGPYSVHEHQTAAEPDAASEPVLTTDPAATTEAAPTPDSTPATTAPATPAPTTTAPPATPTPQPATTPQ